MSVMGSNEDVSVPPLTAQEKVVVGEIKQLLDELEELGVDQQVNLLYLTADILRQTVSDRSVSLLVARDRYAQQLRRIKMSRGGALVG
ncbi:MAG: hypothetical protein RLZ98_3108 [Pseudomonadota bacterium]